MNQPSRVIPITNGQTVTRVAPQETTIKDAFKAITLDDVEYAMFCIGALLVLFGGAVLVFGK